MPENAIPAYITSLIRHFEDLRDGTHGGSTRREDKEVHFEKAVQLLAPVARVEPIVLHAYFGAGFHHPHLRGTPVHDWPLNVFSDEDAAAQLTILRAIASSDLHNLVYRADYRIVPAVTAPATSLAHGPKAT